MALNLTTKAAYKTYIGIKSINEDAAIDILIPRVSQLIKTYCNRTFRDYYDDPKVESFNGGSGFILQESPVVSVQSVESSTDYGQNYTELQEFADWVLDDYIVKPTQTKEFANQLKGYRVTYLAGYETVPLDLELAVIDTISYYLKNDAAVHTARNVNPNTMQVEYLSGTQFPAHIRRILDLYKADYA